MAGADGYLQKQIDEINRKLAAPSQSTSTADPCIPNFAIAYEVIKNRLRATFCSNVPGNTSALITSIIRQLDALDPTVSISPAPNYDNAQLTDRYELDQDETSNQHVEYRFGPRLDYNTVYWLTRLVAVSGEGVRMFNPDKHPLFSDTPLATFTTPVKFGSPSAPHVGNIIENKLDDITKKFDAFIVIQIIAPASASPAGAGTVSVTSGSVNVVGVGTGFTGADVGKAITVNGETHIIAGFTDGTHVAVDFPFKQTLAGQAYNKLTLMTWAQADAEAVVAKFRLTDDPNARAITGRHVFTDDDLALTSIKFRVDKNFTAVRKYDWVRNVIIGHSERTDITPLATQTFIAGGFTDATAGIPELTGVAYQYDTTDPYNDKLRMVSVVATQPNPPVALDRAEFRRFATGAGTVSITNGSAAVVGVGTTFTVDLVAGISQVIVGAQTFTVQSITDDLHFTATANSTATAGGQAYQTSRNVVFEKNLQRMKFHPVTGGQIQFVWGEAKTKKLLAQTFRTTIFAQNGQTRNLDDAFTTGATGEVLTDTDVPVLATNPDTGTTGPTVAQRHAKLDATCKIPSSQINTLDNYQVVLSTQNTAPAGDPSVGSEGVVVIKYGQHVTFNLNYSLDQITGDVYLYFRAHNESGVAHAPASAGWSSWSAGTNQHGYSRIIDEFYGSTAPIHAMGLDRSGTGAAVTNTTTTYQLDSGASSVANYYVGMAIHIPGMAAAADRLRTITAYNNSTKVVTVGVAWSVAPGSAVAFEIHYGQFAAEKSGTGHTTTVIQLGTAVTASALIGYSVYMPSAAGADQIRRIISNTTTAITLEVAMGVALPNNACYIIVRGAFGTANVDGVSGIIAPVAARSYYDSGTGEGVLEMILPSGEAAYGLNDGQVQRYRAGTGALKDTQKIGLTGTPIYRYNPPTNLPTLTFYIRNGYRLNGSDGKSPSSYNVQGYLSSGGTITGYGGYSVASGNTYDPATYTPIDSDPLAQANKPVSGWSSYL